MRDASILSVYVKLYRRFGPQGWWPAKTPFEVMVGAVLTQNTNWGNVEKAIAGLKRRRLLSAARMAAMPRAALARLIRPAGYYNVKARRLKACVDFFNARYAGQWRRMARQDTQSLRALLLEVNGIGEETADSILLYALGKPVFVVDAYTKRIFSRHGFFPHDMPYAAAQSFFMSELKQDTRLFNEFHALIVRTGKEYCRKRSPRCDSCPLRTLSRVVRDA